MRTPDEYFMLEVTYRVPGMAEVVVAGDIGYRMVDGDTLHADLYRPAAATSAALPAVIFVHGDAAPELLRNIKDGGQYVSWGRLVAASGLAAVTFNHRSSRRRTMMHEPASDVEALLRYVFERASDLGVLGRAALRAPVSAAEQSPVSARNRRVLWAIGHRAFAP